MDDILKKKYQYMKKINEDIFKEEVKDSYILRGYQLTIKDILEEQFDKHHQIFKKIFNENN